MNDLALKSSMDNLATERRLTLGPLEVEVMEVMWAFGANNAREVAARMQRSLAYTTVLTTLVRLCKKGLLGREMANRAFVYSPNLSREDWDRHRATEMLSGFLTGPVESRHMLLSCLVDAVCIHDAMLLYELDRRVQRKRKELDQAQTLQS